MRGWGLLTALALAGCAQLPPGDVPSRPPTLVSLNPCSDAVLAELVDPGQLLAISGYSLNAASSSMGLAKARRFRSVSGSAEEVLALRPDRVVADQFLAPATADALRRQGIALLQLPIATSVAESEAQVMQLAELAGHPDRGRALISRINQALAVAAPPAGARSVEAVVWQSGGMVPGPDSLIADLLRRTGFRQISAVRGMKQADVLPLETMLADPPQVILAAGNPRSGEDRLLAHPALGALKGTRRAALDPSLLWCGGETIVRVAARLAEVRSAR